MSKKLNKDYPLIPMADITDEARMLAVAWHENASNWIGDKHKLASDIMNYARRQTALTESQRKEWADSCIKKQARIKSLEDGLRELVKWHEPDGRWNYTAAVEKAKQLLTP